MSTAAQIIIGLPLGYILGRLGWFVILWIEEL